MTRARLALTGAARPSLPVGESNLQGTWHDELAFSPAGRDAPRDCGGSEGTFAATPVCWEVRHEKLAPIEQALQCEGPCVS